MAEQKIKIANIDIPNDRLRDIDPDWAECLAGMIKEAGHKTPIDIVADGERYRLVAGGHRLEAIKILKRKEIDCRVLVPDTDQPAEEMRLHEILENLGRKDFNALERCEALSEMKRVYDVLHPEASKRGGKRGNQHTGGQKSQTEIFSFCQNAAENTGLTDRAVRMAIAIFNGLSPETRERLKGTAFATKQSDLKALSALDGSQQAKVLDLTLGEDPKAGSIADAMIIIEGRKPVSETEQLFKRVSGILPGLPRAARFAVFRLHKKDILALVKKEGWLNE